MRSILTQTFLFAALSTQCVSLHAQVLVVPPEDDVLIEQYVVGQPVLPPPVVMEDNLTLRPGTIVPAGVPLQAFGSGKLARYSYFVSVDNKLVVVDPATRAVVRITNAKR